MEQLKQLESYFREQFENYKQLHRLTVLQQSAIEKVDTDQLEKLIADKQQLIHVIDGKQAAIEEKKQALAEALGVEKISVGILEERIPTDTLTPLKDILKELQTLMEALMSIEKQNEALLHGQMEKIKGKIGHVQSGKRAVNAYEAKYSPDAFYFDKKK